ncbi:MAG: hypothetical protein JJT75_09150 [Opitutales bacterium]|nr:hypothetical protein [Opitutales bacterium]
MKTAIIRASWMEGYGYRLDTKPYVGGALQTKILLEELSLRKDPLHKLTKGHDGGIYNGPQFRRNYVEDPAYGVRFLTGSSMQLADLSNVSLLSKQDATGKKLRHLRLEKGMTLISCSGSIGKMAYVRPEMEGIWSSQDILKVVPDPEKIPPGYLYAFLSSKFGVPLVTSGTYGAIIQHLEPEHIADIDVPRLDPKEELKIHNLVEEAARLRSEASEAKAKAVSELFELTGLPIEEQSASEPFASINSSRLESRLDARFHGKRHVSAYDAVAQNPHGFQTLGSLSCSIVEPLRFKRVPMDQSEHSVGLFGSAGILNADPVPNYWIQPPKPIRAYQILENSILVPRSGSLNGIIGTPVIPIGDVIGAVVTEDAIRVNFEDPISFGFAFIALHNWIGIMQLKSRAYGSAIPHLDVTQIGKVILPTCPAEDFKRIGILGCEVRNLRNEAVEAERSAISQLEQALTAR